ncbi:hypothetical protein [Nonomuraea sp. NPDC048916]|uniref:hypothetical protein n=1 Tax=Nonomuraea sp. NPDC048916 TaxID=3154232 RepID=UPI0033D20298
MRFSRAGLGIAGPAVYTHLPHYGPTAAVIGTCVLVTVFVILLIAISRSGRR